MKKVIFIFVIILIITAAVSLSYKRKTEKVIGVIVPMEHQALTEIVKGLKERLGNVSIKVLNAQGDPNLQRAIIEQLARDQCDVIVPIGTAASQMTISRAKNRKIVCLAADLNGEQSEQSEQSRAACLKDQISSEEALSFLHTAFPKIHKITLLYSSSEKIANEIPSALEAAKSKGIEVQQLMVQSLAELYMVGQAIAGDSQAVFILKDHLIVSGIQTVVQQAEKRQIPVMTSDEGSIISGGAFAIGVREADIGRQGAEMIHRILNGEELSTQTMKGPFPLFVNQKACLKQGVDLAALLKAAERLGYAVEYTGEGL